MNSLLICKQTLQKISELIQSKEFLDFHRLKNRFIRKGILTMTHIIVYLFYTSKQSMSINLSNILQDLPELKFPKVSKQAVSKARQGILDPRSRSWKARHPSSLSAHSSWSPMPRPTTPHLPAITPQNQPYQAMKQVLFSTLLQKLISPSILKTFRLFTKG